MTTENALQLHKGICGSLHTEYPLIGMARAFHRNRRGAPISFRDKPYLAALYAAIGHMERADFCKAVQTGVSEMFILHMLYQSGWQDRIVAYVLPTYAISNRFVSERIDSLLTDVPAYAMRTPGGEQGLDGGSKGNLRRKRFGRIGSMLFLGSNTPTDFVEFSADTMIVDELDECDPENIAKANDRLRESLNPQLLRVSNPGVPGMGIHRAWKDGSRSRWFHRCPHCGERQPMDWLVNYVRRGADGSWVPRDTERANDTSQGDLRPVCRRCKEAWTLTPEGSCWVAEYPGKSPSFHMSRLDILYPPGPVQTIRGYYAEFVIAQLDSNRLRAFWRGVLGWPHEGTGVRITEEMLELCSQNQEPMDLEPDPEQYAKKTMIMGVDVGSSLNVCIDELVSADTPSGYRRKGRRFCALADFEDLHRLVAEYCVEVMVIDSRPETRKAKEIRDFYTNEGTCNVWLAQFHPQSRIGKDAFGLRMEYVEKVITVDRTQLLDSTLDEFRNGHRQIPSDYQTITGYADQMKASVRKLDEGSQRFIWDEGSDPDHYRFADAYARVAQEIHDRSGGIFEL